MMLPLIKLLEIQNFALHNGFKVTIIPDDDVQIFDMKIEYGDREITYRASDNAILVENIEFNGCFEYFVSEMNLLRIIENIGNMFREALDKEAQCTGA